MSRISLVSIAALVVVGRVGWAGEEVAKGGKCCAVEASEKVTKLLAAWKAATEESQKMCAEERTKIQTTLGSLVKECPIGSRMGGTLGYVNETLAGAVKASEACSGKCPASKADAKETAAAEPACEGAKLMATRTKLLTGLSELAGYAASATSGACAKETACAAKAGETTAASAKGSFCEKKAAEIIAMVRKEECDKGAAAILMKEIDGLKCEVKAGEIIAAIRAEKCDDGAAKIVVKAANEILASASGLVASATSPAAATTAKAACCADGSAACCKEGAARATALKASWEKAPAEFAGMCPQKKKELMAAMAEVSGKSKILAIMPDTILTLADGLEALDGVNAKLVEWAKANADALKDVPEESKKSLEAQNALLHDACDVLQRVRSVMKTVAGSEKKTETASN
jgi:hypothetical protein